MQLLRVDQAETSENTGYYTQGGMGPWFLHFLTQALCFSYSTVLSPDPQFTEGLGTRLRILQNHCNTVQGSQNSVASLYGRYGEF